MKSKLILILSWMISTPIASTTVEKISFEELIERTDHIVVGVIINVDAVDEKGKNLSDAEGQTGPGLKNTIRLHVRVSDDGIICSNSLKPKTLIVPLWRQWHYSLPEIRRSTLYAQSVFLLTGANTQPAYYRNFQIGLGSIESILSTLARINGKRQVKDKLNCNRERTAQYYAEKEYKAALGARDKADALKAYHHIQACLQYDPYHKLCSALEKEYLQQIYLSK